MIIAVAVVSLGAGAGLMQVIKSPADAAAERAAPEAGPITVPVEMRELESRIIARGDAAFAGSVEVSLAVGGLGAPPVVTGQVPERGDEVVQADVLLEVTGRPVIALQGALPMYRTLRSGMSGPDVVQLKETLEQLGYRPGTVDSPYDGQTSSAVRALYEDAGYAPPEPDEQFTAALDAAQSAVDAAQDRVNQAENALAGAENAGPSESQLLQAERRVDLAEDVLADARAGGDANLIADAEYELRLAQLNLEELRAGPDTSVQQDALCEARNNFTDAVLARDEAAAAADTPLPVTEVVYIETLPRRVDSVNVELGDTVDGPVMSVSGADMEIITTVSAAESELLTERMIAQVDLPTGETAEAGIVEIGDVSGAGQGAQVRMIPQGLTTEQTEALRSANVRVVIPVSSTEGEVLAVPLAALTAGPGGEERVEVQRGAASDLVEVDVGLTADGFAEVSATQETLTAGDLVVVGR